MTLGALELILCFVPGPATFAAQVHTESVVQLNLPTLPRQSPPPFPEEQPQPSLPAPEDLLQSPPAVLETPPAASSSPELLCVSGFVITGNLSAFSEATLLEVVEGAIFPTDASTDAALGPSHPETCLISDSGNVISGRLLSLADLFKARSAITAYYVEQGYETSGAFLPEQTLAGGLVEIQVLEGSIEAINVAGK